MLPKQLGPYRIIRKLGEGGMGAVYEAADEQDQRVAIKLLTASAAQEKSFMQRFEIEVEAMRMLRHPNIVRLIGFGEQDQQPYYAMELVQGSNLENLLAAGRRFSWREACDIGIQVCQALQHAHHRGIIHRDIKPENIMLGPTGSVKVADFGIARLFGIQGLTLQGGLMGTIHYMSPEQAEGKPASERSDMYSLGMTLYALLTGRPAFLSDNLSQVLQLQKTAPPPPLRLYAPQVTSEFEAVVLKLLEKDPDRRIARPQALARRLQMLLDDPVPGSKGTRRSGDSPSAAPIEPIEIEEPPDSSSSLPTLAGAISTDLSMPLDPEHELDVPEMPSAQEPASPAAPGKPAAGSQPREGQEASVRAASQSPILGSGPIELAGSDEDDEPTAPRLPSIKSVLAAKQAAASNAAPAGADAPAWDATVATNNPAAGTSPGSGPRIIPGAFTTAEEADAIEEEHRRKTAGSAGLDFSALPRLLATVAGVLALAAAGYVLFKPMSADELHQHILTWSADATPRQVEEIRPLLREFAERFPDDARKQEVEAVREALELRDYELKLERRMAMGDKAGLLKAELQPAEFTLMSALRVARSQPALALKQLEALLAMHSETDPQRDKALERCLTVAGRHRDKLREEVRRIQQFQLLDITRQLTRAEALAASEPEKSRAIAQGVLDLFESELWAQARITQAKELLAKLPGK